MRSPRRIPQRAAAVIAVLLALAGCSMLPTAPNAPAKKVSAPSILGTGDIVPQPITNTVDKTVSLVTSKLIDGRVGGVVSAGRWKVVVPKGAYLGIGTITITVPDTTVDRCNLGIFPLSLNQFLQPVELRFLCSSMKEADTRDMRWWNPAIQSFVVIKSWPNDTDVSRCAPLKHFSTYMSGGKAGW